MPPIKNSRQGRAGRIAAWGLFPLLCLLPLMCLLPGCATPVFKQPTGTTPPPGVSVVVAGNWQFQATPANGAAPFSSLSGAIDLASQQQNGVNEITSVLLASSTNCYNGTPVVPLSGSLMGATLHLSSFSVSGQSLTLEGTENAASTQLTGTYAVSGGCADGASGSVSGVKYSDFTGTLNGTIPDGSQRSISLNVTQATLDSGDGTFGLSGSASFQGFSCFQHGAITGTAGSISGSTVSLQLTTDDPSGAHLLLQGQIDPAAQTFSVSSFLIQGGSCAASLPSVTLTRQG